MGCHLGQDCAPVSPVFNAAPLLTALGILKKYEDEFFHTVNAKYNVLKLKRKGVISQDTVTAFNAASNDDEAKEILYDHLMTHGTLETLQEWCEWALAAQGYPGMQELGRKVKDDLAGIGWLVGGISVHACMCARV